MTREARLHKVFGKAWTLKALAAHVGLKLATLQGRLWRGWTIEQAVAAPVEVTDHKSLAGRVFDRLTVVERVAGSHPRLVYYGCRCACGRPGLVRVSSVNLLSGAQRSCGCYRRENAAKTRMRQRRDITGQTFGDPTMPVTVIGLSATMGKTSAGGKLALWDCRCFCGKVFTASGASLRYGNAKSCGCRITRQNHTRKYDLYGSKVTIAEMAEIAGLSGKAIAHRLRRGLHPNEAIRTKRPRAKPRWLRPPADRGPNVIGQTYHRLTVVSMLAAPTKNLKRAGRRALCSCACGRSTLVEVIVSDLTSGARKSCGCLHAEHVAAMGRARGEDLTGRTFGDGKVTVVRLAPPDPKSTKRWPKRRWVCACFCGATFTALAAEIKRGKVVSCGCLKPSNREVVGTIDGKPVTLYDLAERSGLSIYTIRSRIKISGLTAEEAMDPRSRRGRKRA